MRLQQTNPGKYRNSYIFLRLALPSTLKVVITLNSFIGELILGNSTFQQTLSFWVAMVTPRVPVQFHINEFMSTSSYSHILVNHTQATANCSDGALN